MTHLLVTPIDDLGSLAKGVNRRNLGLPISIAILVPAGLIAFLAPGADPELTDIFFGILLVFLVLSVIAIIALTQSSLSRARNLRKLFSHSENPHLSNQHLARKIRGQEYKLQTKGFILAVVTLFGFGLFVQYNVLALTAPFAILAIVVCLSAFYSKPAPEDTLCARCLRPLPDVTQPCPNCTHQNRRLPPWYANLSLLSTDGVLVCLGVALRDESLNLDSMGTALVFIISTLAVIALTLLYHSATQRPLKPKGLLATVKYFATLSSGCFGLFGLVAGSSFGPYLHGIPVLCLVLALVGLFQSTT